MFIKILHAKCPKPHNSVSINSISQIAVAVNSCASLSILHMCGMAMRTSIIGDGAAFGGGSRAVFELEALDAPHDGSARLNC